MQGGEFQFGFFHRGEASISSPKFSTKGSIIFFPSFMPHQVAPVTEGVRYSLVAWFVGPPFKQKEKEESEEYIKKLNEEKYEKNN